MSKPQRICINDQCQSVALTNSRLCKFHTRKRRTDTSRRAVAARLAQFGPEHRDLDGFIEPLMPNTTFAEVDALAIIRTADSVTRAILTRQIDYPRAKLLLYTMQMSRNLRKKMNPKDPHLQACNHSLQALSLALTTMGDRKRLRRT